MPSNSGIHNSKRAEVADPPSGLRFTCANEHWELMPWDQAIMIVGSNRGVLTYEGDPSRNAAWMWTCGNWVAPR